jgi:hypothetical protein
MPNWVMHKLVIKGKPEDVQALIEYVKSADGPFSLDRIIPMPKGLDETADEHLLSKEKAAALRARNRKAFGHEDWYSWSVENWGTKWDVADATLESQTDVELLATIETGRIEAVYHFDTAWNTCKPVIEVLARHFPAIRIEHGCIEEQPSFGGRDIYENGDCVQSILLRTPQDIWLLSDWHGTFEPKFDEDE